MIRPGPGFLPIGWLVACGLYFDTSCSAIDHVSQGNTSMRCRAWWCNSRAVKGPAGEKREREACVLGCKPGCGEGSVMFPQVPTDALVGFQRRPLHVGRAAVILGRSASSSSLPNIDSTGL